MRNWFQQYKSGIPVPVEDVVTVLDQLTPMTPAEANAAHAAGQYHNLTLKTSSGQMLTVSFVDLGRFADAIDTLKIAIHEHVEAGHPL